LARSAPFGTKLAGAFETAVAGVTRASDSARCLGSTSDGLSRGVSDAPTQLCDALSTILESLRVRVHEFDAVTRHSGPSSAAS
jgi:hypothetical protein